VSVEQAAFQATRPFLFGSHFDWIVSVPCKTNKNDFSIILPFFCIRSNDIMVYIFNLPLYKKLGVLIIFSLIWSQSICSSIFLLETFETCVILLEDFQPNSSKQGDIIHEIIGHLQPQQKSPQCLIIKTKRSLREIHSDIFRSMKYDCFLYVHFNLETISYQQYHHLKMSYKVFF